jgi:hypothetical protein
MINIDTSYLKKIQDLSLGQLVFLNLVADKSNNNQKDASVIRLITDEEIQDLIKRDLLSQNKDDNKIVYEVTQTFNDLVGDTDDPFKQFYDLYPTVVIRPDGTRGYLRTNTNKCKLIYKQTIGKSPAMHKHIMDCLQHEIDYRMSTNSLSYMKTMYRWLTNREWEVSEEQMKDDVKPTNKKVYGTELI